MASEQTPTDLDRHALVKPVFDRFAGKCDGDHGMPECSSPWCWHRDPPEPANFDHLPPVEGGPHGQ